MIQDSPNSFVLQNRYKPLDIYCLGDIVFYRGLQYAVKEIRPNSQMKLDNGEVVWHWEVLRIAKQDNFFGDLGLPEKNIENTVQLVLI